MIAVKSERRTRCSACGGNDLHKILDLGSSPLADSFPKEPIQEETYPLELLLCSICGMVHLSEIVADDLLFGKDYAFFTGASPSLVEHYRQYAADVMERFPEQCRMGVLEIASNDGTLLKFFSDAGKWTLGVEPAAPPAEMARYKNGIHTVPELFDLALAEKLAASIKDGRFEPFIKQPGVIIANHVLAHVRDPLDFLQGIRTLLAPDGVAIIEFQYWPDLFFGNEWDHVYHEHRSFLSFTALCNLANKAGLSAVDAVHSTAQGGSLRVTLTEASRRVVISTRAVARYAKERGWGLDYVGTYKGWQGRVDYGRDRLQEIVGDFNRAGKTVWGYGASAKSSTLLNYCGFNAGDLDYVVDTTPHKIGRYTPGTHIPIVGSDEAPDAYLLLVWNYLEGVLRREHQFMADGGKFIVPIPHPVVL